MQSDKTSELMITSGQCDNRDEHFRRNTSYHTVIDPYYPMPLRTYPPNAVQFLKPLITGN